MFAEQYESDPCSFDFKNEIHDGRIVNCTCLLCKSETERELHPHHILLTVNLNQCFESSPCQHPCTVKLYSGTVVETLMSENVIREMMVKAQDRGTVSPAIREQWYQIMDHCSEIIEQ